MMDVCTYIHMYLSSLVPRRSYLSCFGVFWVSSRLLNFICNRMVWDFEQQNGWMVWDFQLWRQVHMTFRACRARAAICWIIYWVKCTQCLLYLSSTLKPRAVLSELGCNWKTCILNCYPMQSGSRSWYSLLGFIKCDCLLAKRLIKALPMEAIWMLLLSVPLFLSNVSPEISTNKVHILLLIALTLQIQSGKCCALVGFLK